MRWNTVVRAAAAGFVLLMVIAICWHTSYSSLREVQAAVLSPSILRVDSRPSPKGAAAKAGNSTLGFSSIFWINMKSRYDRVDAISLQAYLSGLDFVAYPAVEPDMIADVGMPPTKSPGSLKAGEKGCWRAHANIWAEVLRRNLPPVLILESDAAWDVNIREIMPNLNRHFNQFLASINSTRLHNPNGWTLASQAAPGTHAAEMADDPWLSDHWDLLSLGQCHESGDNKDVKLIYEDPYVPPGQDYWGRTLGRERVIRKSGGPVCTTAYAISQTGAAKLLLKSALNLDSPVDLLMAGMVSSGTLVAYSVMPPIVAQWQYVPNIGMEHRGANSDINGEQETELGSEDEAWTEVDKVGSVWTTKPYHPDVAFEEMALERAWKSIFGAH